MLLAWLHAAAVADGVADTAAGRAVVASARAVTAAYLDAGAAVAAAGTAAAFAAFLFATQPYLQCLPFLLMRVGRALAAVRTHAQRIHTEEVIALVASLHFKNQSGRL